MGLASVFGGQGAVPWTTVYSWYFNPHVVDNYNGDMRHIFMSYNRNNQIIAKHLQTAVYYTFNSTNVSIPVSEKAPKSGITFRHNGSYGIP